MFSTSIAVVATVHIYCRNEIEACLRCLLLRVVNKWVALTDVS